MNATTTNRGVDNICPSCGGKASWGYGYAAGPLGSYLMCEKCMHVLQFERDGYVNQLHSDEPNAPFWMVWNPQGCAPTYKHVTVESAKAEAERLAKNNPGQRFHVLMLQGTCSYNTVNWIMADPNHVPF